MFLQHNGSHANATVRAVSFCGDNATVATASLDQTGKLWRGPATGRGEHTLIGNLEGCVASLPKCHISIFLRTFIGGALGGDGRVTANKAARRARGPSFADALGKRAFFLGIHLVFFFFYIPSVLCRHQMSGGTPAKASIYSVTFLPVSEGRPAGLVVSVNSTLSPLMPNNVACTLSSFDNTAVAVESLSQREGGREGGR